MEGSSREGWDGVEGSRREGWDGVEGGRREGWDGVECSIMEGWDGVGRYVQGSDAIYLVFNFLLIFCNINFTCYKQLAPVTKDIPISVLRASILGPILFLCYINDLPGSTLLYSVHTSFC